MPKSSGSKPHTERIELHFSTLNEPAVLFSIIILPARQSLIYKTSRNYAFINRFVCFVHMLVLEIPIKNFVNQIKKKASEKKHNDFRVSAIIELTIAKSKHPGSNSDRPNTNPPRTSKPAQSNVNFMFFRYMIDHIENK